MSVLIIILLLQSIEVFNIYEKKIWNQQILNSPYYYEKVCSSFKSMRNGDVCITLS